MNIEELNLPVRAFNALKRAGINTVEEYTTQRSEKAELLGEKLISLVDGILKQQNTASSESDQNASVLTYIEVSKIDPHPNNPRKDVGDVSELAESIKQNGIMQNLTVVPWFSNITGQPADDNSMDGYYRALIGHRRLAAAKLAGIEKVPCAIVTNLTLNEQVAIMLAENMQRADLSTLEQAEGIQMMFDLGDTVDSVSQKTGLSKTTVRRRAKLMEYDRDAVREAFERGATIADYELLDKIKDEKKRAELVKKIGTNNFKWEVDRAIDKEKRVESDKKICEFLDTFATRVEEHDYNTMRHIKCYNNDEKKYLVKPDNFDESKNYFYVCSSYSIYLYVEKDKESDSEAEARTRNETANKEREERKSNLDNVLKQMRKSRIDFLQGFNSFPCQKATEELDCVYKIVSMVLTGELAVANEYGLDDVASLLKLNTPEEENDSYEEEASYLSEQLEKENISGAKRLLTYMILKFETGSTYNWSGQYVGDSALSYIYKVLKVCGYVISDEEQAMIDGTHELYLKEVADNG